MFKRYEAFRKWHLKRDIFEFLSYCGVMKMFTPDRIPVLTHLAQEFAIMDRFFAAHPGPTWPNRQFCLSGTSGGQTETGVWNLGIVTLSKCREMIHPFSNEPGNLFKQKTFFDQISQAGLTWRNYVNDTPWEMSRRGSLSWKK